LLEYSIDHSALAQVGTVYTDCRIEAMNMNQLDLYVYTAWWCVGGVSGGWCDGGQFQFHGFNPATQNLNHLHHNKSKSTLQKICFTHSSVFQYPCSPLRSTHGSSSCMCISSKHDPSPVVPVFQLRTTLQLRPLRLYAPNLFTQVTLPFCDSSPPSLLLSYSRVLSSGRLYLQHQRIAPMIL
jgi:hypothetical protein